MHTSFPARRRPGGLARVLLAGAAASALCVGQAQAQDPDADTEVEEVVVSGMRAPPGSVIGDITPEVVMSPAEIRGYGAASVTELLTALSSQISSGQGSGPPVVLINGGRVTGFREIRDLPTEAIARVEILPEEVSLKYGYPAEQKVVNFVLRARFRAWLAEGTATTPTAAGGGETIGAHGARLNIRRGQRLMVDARSSRTGAISESDRDVVGSSGAFRTLQPESTDTVFNAVYARPFDNGVSMSLNGTFESRDSESLLGRSALWGNALVRRSDSDEGEVAAALTGAWNGWQWSYTGELGRTVARSDTDREAGGASFTDWSKSTTTTLKSDVVAHRGLFELPAGQATSTLALRGSALELDSDALRGGVMQSTDLSRSIGELRGNVDLPITGSDSAIGKLSANVNAAYQHLSDFGDLQTLGAGLNWSPAKAVRLLASVSRTDQAPSLEQLGAPVTATPGVRVFDLARGETAEVTRIAGGASGLDAGQRDMLKLGLTYKPFEKTDLRFQANYVATRTTDAVVEFPSASTQVEAAFPDRFVRDADGRLVRIDARPVNFARQTREELRWGVTYSRRLGPQPTPEQIAAMRRRFAEAEAARAAGTPAAPDRPGARDAQGAQAQGQAQRPSGGQRPEEPPEGPPPGAMPPDHPPISGFAGGRGPGGGMAGGMGGGPGGFGGFGSFQRMGVLQLGLYHTVVFKDEVLIRQGLPALDLLDGAALGAGGGSPRHQVDLQANYSRGGYGVAADAQWRSGTRIVGGATGEDLDFSDLTTINLRLFADLGATAYGREHRWLRGARATLTVDNLFDTRQEVRTASGAVPLSYQEDLLDPVGRTVRLTVRKLIF